VHHLTYAHIGAEPLFDLVAICSCCHKELSPPKAALPLLANGYVEPPDGARSHEDR
jgi:hypothetical protein